MKSLRLNEEFSKWGFIGNELVLKKHKAGGAILLCKKIVCGHVFSTIEQPTPEGVGFLRTTN